MVRMVPTIEIVVATTRINANALLERSIYSPILKVTNPVPDAGFSAF
jgi:hypothetical protein